MFEIVSITPKRIWISSVGNWHPPKVPIEVLEELPQKRNGSRIFAARVKSVHDEKYTQIFYIEPWDDLELLNIFVGRTYADFQSIFAAMALGKVDRIPQPRYQDHTECGGYKPMSFHDVKHKEVNMHES